MPPITSIPTGPVFSMVQNQVYAVAGRRRLYTDIAATILQSNTSAFTASTAVTLVEGSYEITAPFIKLTSAGPVNVRLTKSN